MKLRLGEPLPIALFLEPSDTDKSPIATAFDVSRKILWQSGMRHDVSGIYYVDGYEMLETPLIRVVYDVPDAMIESDGVMVRKYERAEDIFELDQTLTKQEVTDSVKQNYYIRGRIVKSQKHIGFIKGLIK